VGKSPANLIARGPLVQKSPRIYKILKFLVGSLGPYTVLLRAGSFFRELGVTSLTITGRTPTIDSRGVPKGIYATLRKHTVSKAKYVRPPCKTFS